MRDSTGKISLSRASHERHQARACRMEVDGASALFRERFEVSAADAAIRDDVPTFLAARLHAGPERSFDGAFNPFRLLGRTVVVIDQKSLLHLAAAFRAPGIRHGGPIIRPDVNRRQTRHAIRTGASGNTIQPNSSTTRWANDGNSELCGPAPRSSARIQSPDRPAGRRAAEN